MLRKQDGKEVLSYLAQMEMKKGAHPLRWWSGMGIARVCVDAVRRSADAKSRSVRD
jgi:streptomycin 6-kinase